MTSTRTYEITHELFGDCVPATADEIREIVAEWNDGVWAFAVQVDGDELRVYCERDRDDDDDCDDDSSRSPNKYVNWTMVTRDYGYIVVGTAQS